MKNMPDEKSLSRNTSPRMSRTPETSTTSARTSSLTESLGSGDQRASQTLASLSTISVPSPVPKPATKKQSLSFHPLTFTGGIPDSSRKKKTRLCASCGTTESPEWRTGPDGRMSLCNRCGLRFRKLKQKREAALLSDETEVTLEDIRKTKRPASAIRRSISNESSSSQEKESDEDDDEVRDKMSMKRILN